jgi:DNA-binding MarR family transcriptional regulator
MEMMSDGSPVSIDRLRQLADFRFQLRKFLSFSETASESAGVSAQQYQLLQVVAAVADGRGASISYLAERMILRHNSAVELVDRAVRAGLVRRESDEDDLRRSLVLMTPEGEQVLDLLVMKHLEELEMRGHEMMAAMERVLAGKKRDRNMQSVGTQP